MTTMPPLNAPALLTPLLPALPAAAASTEPAIGVLPLLSPILRQRVQLLGASSTEPWLRLLCYSPSKVAQLNEIARSERLESHPVSGEVEVDWDYDVQTRYKRLDVETLQALVVFSELGLAFQVVFCVNDPDGAQDGWKVGEVTVVDKSSPFAEFGGVPTLEEAERRFNSSAQGKQTPSQLNVPEAKSQAAVDTADDEDDGYWDRYDATPARTPADGRSPAPPAAAKEQAGAYRSASAEDSYYAQYDDVQPAMDNHDPDEAAQQAHIMPPLGLGAEASIPKPVSVRPETNGSRDGWAQPESDSASRELGLLHPRPESSASSNGSHNVARLEETAGKQEQNEFGVKQHVSRSIRSLFLLSRASGIDREEFEQMVKMELDLLGMIDDQE